MYLNNDSYLYSSIVRSHLSLFSALWWKEAAALWRWKCHRVRCEHTLTRQWKRLVYSGCARHARPSLSTTFYGFITYFYSYVKGSLYETFNLDRGGNNRKKKIEEFSKSSREKLVQSKNKMFSKFTSILQHAVEAVSWIPNTDIYSETCLLSV